MPTVSWNRNLRIHDVKTRSGYRRPQLGCRLIDIIAKKKAIAVERGRAPESFLNNLNNVLGDIFTDLLYLAAKESDSMLHAVGTFHEEVSASPF
jgi:hypothetical protein